MMQFEFLPETIFCLVLGFGCALFSTGIAATNGWDVMAAAELGLVVGASIGVVSVIISDR